MSAKLSSLWLLALMSGWVMAVPEDMETSESQQSYGFGYGTKVADKYSVATGGNMLKRGGGWNCEI